MPAPILYSTTGATLSSEEMAFAQRVAASFFPDMDAGWIKTIRQVDPNTNAAVEYHADKNIAYVTPGGAVDYVGVQMPNPVPYRGVSIGLIPNSDYTPSPPGGTLTNIVMSSDGITFASELVTYSAPYWRYPPALHGDVVHWNGSDGQWLFLQNTSNSAYTFDHKMVWSVPEDCIYPTPLGVAPYYSGSDGLSSQWNADWQAGVTAFNTRRKAWFLKNSTEFIAALKGKFQPGAAGVTRAELQTGTIPASWDYRIKNFIGIKYSSFYLADGSKAGRHTKMPIIMSVTSAADVVVSDTSANLTQAGTKVTKRVTTFAYTDADGKAWSVPIDGTFTQVVTEHRSGTYGYAWAVSATYLNWYSTTVPGQNPSLSVYMRQEFGREQFRQDWEPYELASMGVWNGLETYCLVGVTLFTDSTWVVAPTNPLPWTTYNPPIPVYSNTLSSTAPDILLQYHNTVIPTYVANTAQSSTVMNNSAMYGVKEVHISPVGLIADSSVTYTKSTTLTGIPSTYGGNLVAGTYYARLYAYGVDAAGNFDSSKFINASRRATVTVVDNAQILFQWQKMQYMRYTENPAGVLTDCPLYALNVMLGDQSYWIFPGGAAPYEAVVTDMTRGYPHPFPDVATAARGMFGEGDGNRVTVHGTAVYTFDWSTGALTFKRWKPLFDVDGNEVASRGVDLPAGSVWSDNPINCIVTYKGLHWPDVIEYVKLRNADAKSETFAKSDPVWWAIVQAIK